MKKGSKKKPNAQFWIIILTMTVAIVCLVLTLVLILTSQGPLFAKANIGNIVGLITSILLLISGYLHIRNHRSDLFGLPGEGGNEYREYHNSMNKESNTTDKPGKNDSIPTWLLLYVYVILFVQLYNLISGLIK